MTYLWYDLETFGTSPRTDRIAQFAAVRTDQNLEPVAPPTTLYCQLPADYLPDPEACLVTGIGPSTVQQKGVTEAEFAQQVHALMSEPQTCALGYNSLRFDDEFIRFLFWRNFIDPYAREYANGNSRWDLIDVVRLCYATRPAGIEWPLREDGAPSFRLEDLTAANGIEHGAAHDALADVDATMALARLIRQRQPRLFDYCARQRSKAKAAEALDWQNLAPVIHVSSRYPAQRGCLALVAPLALHPHRGNAVIAYDLTVDPSPLADCAVDELRRRLFSPADELGDVPRLPLKLIHTNKAPVLCPRGVLTAPRAEQLGIDLAACDRHLDALRRLPDVASLARAIYAEPPAYDAIEDPEQQLYDGFVPDADRHRISAVPALTPAQLAQQPPQFEDRRLPPMLFRYRARNFPDSLTDAEQEAWTKHCAERLDDNALGYRSRTLFAQQLADLRDRRPEHAALWADLESLLTR